MEADREGKLILELIFIGIYIVIGCVWFTFYISQGIDVIFNSRYDYLTLIGFHIISGIIIIGYIRMTNSILVMGFLFSCGLIALPVLIDGYISAMNVLFTTKALIDTRLIILSIHIVTYTIVGIKLFYICRENSKSHLMQ